MVQEDLLKTELTGRPVGYTELEFYLTGIMEPLGAAMGVIMRTEHKKQRGSDSSPNTSSCVVLTFMAMVIFLKILKTNN